MGDVGVGCWVSWVWVTWVWVWVTWVLGDVGVMGVG